MSPCHGPSRLSLSLSWSVVRDPGSSTQGVTQVSIDLMHGFQSLQGPTQRGPLVTPSDLAVRSLVLDHKRGSELLRCLARTLADRKIGASSAAHGPKPSIPSCADGSCLDEGHLQQTPSNTKCVNLVAQRKEADQLLAL